MSKYYRFFFLILFLTGLGLTNISAQPEMGVAVATKGKLRIGLAAVKTTNVGEGIDPQQFGAAIQNSLGEYLKSSEVELVLIEARLPSAIEEEVKEKEVDYLVYVAASHKKGGGGFGKVFGKVAPVLGQTVPIAGVGGGVGGAIAGQVASTAIITAGTMASNVKAKDSLQLDLTVQKPGPKSAVFAKSYKAKAKTDGEDIISPLIEQMAQAVIDTAAGKKVTPADGK